MEFTHRTRINAPVLLTLAVLLVLGAAGCSKSPEEIKAEQAKVEAETTGRLLVKSNRPNTTVEVTRVPAAGEAAAAGLKGNEEGAAEQTLSRLLPGKYTVIARADGWPEVRAEATVQVGQTAETAIHFPSGSLRLDSVPTGATVRLGKTELGKTPLVIPQLPPGECPLSLEYPSWPAVAYKAAIAENTESAATVRLPHGKVSLDSHPSGATVLQGRKTIGTTPLSLDPVPVGVRKFTMQAKGFPTVEISVTVADGQEVKFRPALGSFFPVLDPAELLRAVWIPDDPSKITTGFNSTTGVYRPKNDVIKNIHRDTLYKYWQHKPYRFSGPVKSYDAANGRLEFAEQKSELARCRVVTQVRPGTNPGLAAQKGATVAVYGRLTAVEEPAWPGRVITLELSDAEFLPDGTP